MRQQAEFMLLIISQSASEITKKYPKIFKKHLKFFKKIDREYFPYYNSQKKCIYFWSDAMADKE